MELTVFSYRNCLLVLSTPRNNITFWGLLLFTILCVFPKSKLWKYKNLENSNIQLMNVCRQNFMSFCMEYTQFIFFFLRLIVIQIKYIKAIYLQFVICIQTLVSHFMLSGMKVSIIIRYWSFLALVSVPHTKLLWLKFNFIKSASIWYDTSINCKIHKYDKSIQCSRMQN